MTLVQLWAKLNPAGLTLAHYLLDLLWQSSLLLIGVGILTWCLRKRSASLRHALWVGAILVIPFLPLLTSTAVRLGSPQLPVRVRSFALPVAPTLPAPSADAQAQYLHIPPAVLLNDEPVILQLAARPWTLVVVVYFLALLRLSGWMGIGLWQLWRWKRKATPSERRAVQEVFREASRQLGLKRPVQPMESAHVPTAVALGLWRPVVLLPQGQLDTLSPQDLMKIALHECAHVRRRDTLLLRAMLVVRALCFFQPLAWLAVSRATLLAEHACDEAVLRATGEPLPYAKLLTRLAEADLHPSFSMRMATGILFNKGAFVERVEAVLDEGRARVQSLSRLARGLIGLAAVTCLTVAIAAPLNGAGKAGGFGAAGRIVDEQGRPVADADVYACLPNEESIGFVLKTQTKSGAQGAFRFDNLPRKKDGSWICILYAWKKGHAWGSRYEDDWRGRPERAAGVTGVEIKLLAPATFEGRVVNRANEPIANARVTGEFWCGGLDDVCYKIWSAGESFGCQHTDKDGRFRFQDVPAGSRVRLEVVAEGYGMLGINSYNQALPGEPPLTNRTPYFQLGKEARIQLGPESQILGTLVESVSGKPVANVKIGAYERTDLAITFTKTDAAGRFILKGLVPGEYRIYALLFDGHSYRVRTARVAVGEGEKREGVQLKLEEGVRLTGRVLDKTSGKPLEGIQVGISLREERTAISATTNSQGEYALVIVPGTYEVTAAAGRQFVTVPVSLTEGQRELRLKDMLLVPNPEATVKQLQFQVVDEQGQPVSQVRAEWLNRTIGTSRADGILDITAMKEMFFGSPESALDRLGMSFTSPKGDLVALWAPKEKEYDAAPEPIEITLQKAGSVAGTALTADGKPAVGASVILQAGFPLPGDEALGYRESAKVLTDERGQYLLRSLIPGRTYMLTISGKPGVKAGRAYSKDFTVKAGEVVTLPPMTLPLADRTITGRFLDEEGKPLAELAFGVEGTKSGIRQLKSDKEGRFEISDVAAEDLSLWITDQRADAYKQRAFKIIKEQLTHDTVLELERK